MELVLDFAKREVFALKESLLLLSFKYFKDVKRTIVGRRFYKSSLVLLFIGRNGVIVECVGIRGRC